MADVPPTSEVASTSDEASTKGRALFDQAKHLEEKYEEEAFQAARALLLEAAEKYNYAPAQNTYGEYLYYGRGGPMDESESVKYFTLAAEQDDHWGLWHLADMHANKRGGLSDTEKAKELYLKSAEKGNWRAKGDYDYLIEREEMMKHDIEVIQSVTAAAEGGDAAARFQLAQYYQYGTTSLPQDVQKGLEHLQLAAEAGHTPAIMYLGRCYDYAYFDLQEDDAVALEWYRRAADQGDESALCKIGEFYEHGYGGLEASIDSAREYYGKAGSLGEAEIERLDKPEKDRALIRQLTEAADTGDADAQYELGTAYRYGSHGLECDPVKALELYRAAADTGSAKGRLGLGELYLYGDWEYKLYRHLGLDRSQALEVAKGHFQLLADQGNAEAADYIATRFSGKSVGRGGGYYAVITGKRRSDSSEDGSAVLLDFEAVGDGSYNGLPLPYIYGGEGCSLIFYKPGEYKYFSPSWPVRSKSVLTVEEDNKHVGTLYFELSEEVAQGPFGMEFEYYNGFSRIHLGILE